MFSMQSTVMVLAVCSCIAACSFSNEDLKKPEVEVTIEGVYSINIPEGCRSDTLELTDTNLKMYSHSSVTLDVPIGPFRYYTTPEIDGVLVVAFSDNQLVNDPKKWLLTFDKRELPLDLISMTTLSIYEIGQDINSEFDPKEYILNNTPFLTSVLYPCVGNSDNAPLG